MRKLAPKQEGPPEESSSAAEAPGKAISEPAESDTPGGTTRSRSKNTTKGTTGSASFHPDATPIFSKKWRLFIIIFAVLLVAGTGFRIFQNLFKPIKADADQSVLTVTVEPTQRQLIHKHLKLSGSVWAWDHLTIGAEIGGLRIATVNVDEGDIVKKGDVLATLNSALIKAQLEREKARLNRAQVNLQKTKQPNRPMDIVRLKAVVAHAASVVSQEQANLAGAKANLKNAQTTAARYKVLSEEGAVSMEDFDNKTMQKETAEADYRNVEERLAAANFMKVQAEENLKLALEGGMKEDIQMAGADIEEIKANINHLSAQLDQTIIKAPCHGLIVKRLTHIGDISIANEDLFQMVRDNRFEVRAQVPEQDLPKIRPGQAVEFQCAAGGAKRLNGKIREISPLIDTNTRLATVRIDLPCERGWLPGTFASGIVDLGVVEALVVPDPAVVDKDGRKIVFVLEGNRVFGREVKVGERVDSLVEVLSGLKEGEQVVTTGSGFLKDGDLVRLGQKAATANGAGALGSVNTADGAGGSGSENTAKAASSSAIVSTFRGTGYSDSGDITAGLAASLDASNSTLAAISQDAPRSRIITDGVGASGSGNTSENSSGEVNTLQGADSSCGGDTSAGSREGGR